MKDFKVIFVTPKHGNWMDKVGALVQCTTGSRWAHVAGYLFDGVYEAIMPEVMVSPLDKYLKEEKIEVLTLTITNADYRRIEEKARELLGKDVKYGIKDCAVGFIATFFGRWLAKKIAWLLRSDKDNTLNCVGLYGTLLLQTNTFGNFMRDMGWNEKNISWMVPQDLYSVIKSYYRR